MLQKVGHVRQKDVHNLFYHFLSFCLAFNCYVLHVILFNCATLCSVHLHAGYLGYLDYYIYIKVMIFLSNFMSQCEVGGHFLDKTRAAYYSTFFDIDGIVGSIAIGYLSDRLKLRGIACVLMTALSIPAVMRNQFFSCQLLVS